MDTRTFAGLLAASPPTEPEHHRAHGGAHTARRLPRPGRRGRQDRRRSRLACAQAQDYASSTGRPEGGAAMAAAAPALLSGLPQLLLRRPPSLRELVIIVGYADDYAWFSGAGAPPLSRRGGGGRSRPPTCARRVERFANLFAEQALPPLRLRHRVLLRLRG